LFKKFERGKIFEQRVEMSTQFGTYTLIKELGHGFGGVVYLAESNQQQVALKQLQINEGCLTPEEVLESFKSEFSVLKELNHPHIVKILDFGFDLPSKKYFFTTEYIEGADVFEATRNLDPEQIESLFVQALRALSYLHRRQVYHHDIKPANLLVETYHDHQVTKLIDFGMTRLRKKGVLAGSPAYLAPEAILGQESLDGRADLYALGVAWYECLTGENPFRRSDLKEMLHLQKVWTPPPITSYSPEIPSYLDPIFDKLLKKNPAERYHHADQVIRDLNLSSRHRYPLETMATALAYLPGEGQLVGRQREWAEVISCFDKVFTLRTDSIGCIAISGDPGTGKSRLLKELKYYAQLHTVSVMEVKEIPFPELTTDCVVILEDATKESIDSLRQWLKQPHRYQLLAAVTSANTRSIASLGNHIHLNPFDLTGVAQYIGSVLGVESSPQFLVDELLSRSQGNPLILTEILHSLISSHQIFDEAGQWSPSFLKEIGINFQKFQVPKTLNEYCKNRYNNLPKDCRKILIAVAIAKAPLERNFLKKNNLGVTLNDCTLLEETGLICSDPITGKIKLNNPSFYDWVPQYVEPAILAEVHQTLGEYFLSEEKKAVAWAHMGRGTGSKEERYRYLNQSGDSLLKKTQWLEAAQIFETASLLAPSQEDCVGANLKRSQALLLAGHHEEAIKVLQETQTLLKHEKENPGQWRWVEQTFAEMCHFYLKASRLDSAREALHISKVLLEEHGGDPIEEMILENYQASLLFREGKLEEAIHLFETTREKWESFPLEIKKRVVNNELGAVYLAKGRSKEAKSFFQADSAFYQASGDLTKRALAIYGWAESCCHLQQFVEAEKIYEFCVDLSRELKNEELLFHAYAGLGNIAYFQERWDLCVDYYERALELAQRQLHSDYHFAMSINLAIAHRHLKDYSSARMYLQYVLDALEPQTSPSLRHLTFLAQTSLELGKVYSESEEWIEARDAYRETLRIARHYEALQYFCFPASIGLLKVVIKLERIKEYQSLLRDLEQMKLSVEERKGVDELKEFVKESDSPKYDIDFLGKEKRWETIVIGFKTTL
jgi:tetratricopeptide (TPR) repeat protein